jgi:hypothetical protein
MRTSTKNESGLGCGLALLVILLSTVGAHAARAGQTAPPGAKRMSCAHRTAVFRERLEPVIEAVIDGKPERTARATSRAEQWWARHGAELKTHAGADSTLRAMVAAGGKGQPMQAAGLALILATQSLDWCQRPIRTADRLMRLDLFGMAAWLHTQGEHIPLPGGVDEATEIIAKKLVAKGHQDLANELGASAATVRTADAAGSKGSAPAKSFLDLIDRVEGATK